MPALPSCHGVSARPRRSVDDRPPARPRPPQATRRRAARRAATRRRGTTATSCSSRAAQRRTRPPRRSTRRSAAPTPPPASWVRRGAEGGLRSRAPACSCAAEPHGRRVAAAAVRCAHRPLLGRPLRRRPDPARRRGGLEGRRREQGRQLAACAAGPTSDGPYSASLRRNSNINLVARSWSSPKRGRQQSTERLGAASGPLSRARTRSPRRRARRAGCCAGARPSAGRGASSRPAKRAPSQAVRAR